MADDVFLTLPDRGGAALRVVFSRRGDRFAHRIEVGRDGTWETLAESSEGATDEAWPPSPPLQQLHTEQREGGRVVALLVGMAGRGHWSLVVEPTSDLNGFLFDVACRVSQAPTRLASTYHLLAAGEQFAIGRVRVSGRNSAAVIFDGIRSTESPTEPLGATIDANRRVTFPAEIAVERLPATLRWRYQIVVDHAVAQLKKDPARINFGE